MDNNPRYPHRFSVYRPVKANGKAVLDEEGNPTYEVLPLAKVAMVNGWMVRDTEGKPIVEEEVEWMPCGYRTNTRNLAEMGDVVNYNITLHCPPFLTPLFFDDIIEITDYDRTFRARVAKKATFNWGTAIWYDEIMN